jgi:outer membrane protein OmpA-like peptidoglycan-associated protein
MVNLGGSRVFTPASAFRFFGLESGAVDAFKATYEYFGDLGVQAYPSEMPSYPAYSEIFNSTYLKAIKADKTVTVGDVDAPNFEEAPVTSQVVASRTWDIKFRTGSSDFSDTSALEELMTVLAIAENTVVEVHGHTDNVGNPDFNRQLSEDRAAAVKTWLNNKAGKTFPSDRIKVIAHGQDNPVASNGTKAGQAQNRRVEIILKSN